MGKVDVRVEIDIARPAGVVSAYSSDPQNAPEWYEKIKSIEWVSEPGVRLGARMTFVAQFLGKRLEYTYEIVEWTPGKKLVLRTAQGPFPMETTYEWEGVGDSATRMTLQNRGRPSGFSAVFAPFMSLMMRRAMRKDLALLKTILESR